MQLAKQGDSILRLEEIAQRENVSSNFLVQILNALKNEGVIQSKRGKHGGYFMERRPEDIKLFEIVKAVKSGLIEEVTVKEGESAVSVAQGWEKFSAQLEKLLKDTTLEDMMSEDGTYMYYI